MAPFMSAPPRQTMPTIQQAAIRTQERRRKATAGSKPSEFPVRRRGPSSRPRSAAARQPTFLTTPTTAQAGVCSVWAATAVALLGVSACSISTRTTPRRARAPTSARDSFSTPNGGPGAAAPGAFPSAPADGKSASQKLNGVRGEAPSTRFLKITYFVIFSRFFVCAASRRYNSHRDCLRHAPGA